jgi:glyoxylase-like metal-dependent hydrolase (beta-lactamase superfamily II)
MFIGGLLGGSMAVCAAPTEASGHYHMQMGDFGITALSDGSLSMHTVDFKVPGTTPVIGFLVKTGEKLVLIDTGAGTLLGPGVGELMGNLRAAGYKPEQVDEICITDMRPDQIGGLLSERKAAFPSAIVRASRGEADYWLAKSTMALAPVEHRQEFAGIGAALKPYVTGGRFNTFEQETDIVPGIRALPSTGHAPPKTIYVAESRGQKILFMGDEDIVSPVATRIALFKDAAAHGYWVAGTHLPFPGIGRLHAAGHGFEWVPLKKTTP